MNIYRIVVTNVYEVDATSETEAKTLISDASKIDSSSEVLGFDLEDYVELKSHNLTSIEILNFTA